MKVNQAKRLKALEKENPRLKRLVAEKELDIQILKEAMAFEAKVLVERWRREYNHIRPHSPLGYKPPAP